MLNRYVSLALWIIGLQAVSFGISLTAPLGGDVAWYASLIKSNLTPPDFVFGIVWPILYVLIAIAGWMLWTEGGSDKAKGYFSVQLLLNWSWMPVFALLHSTTAGALVILFGLLSTLMVIKECCGHKQHLVSGLLTPYVLWMCFALYLNTFIYLSN